MRVVIVGAGLSGLTLAAFLRCVNIDTVILEKKSHLHASYVAPYTLYANALSCYRAFNVVLPTSEDEYAHDKYFGIVNHNNEWLCRIANRRVHLHTLDQSNRISMTTAPCANSNSIVSQRFCETSSRYNGHVPLRTSIVSSALRDTLRHQAGAIKYSCNVVDIVPHDGYKGGVHVVSDSGHSEWGDVVVAADGLSSSLRALMFPTIKSSDGQGGVRTQVDGVVEDVSPEFVHGEGYPVDMWGREHVVSFTPFCGGQKQNVCFSAFLHSTEHGLALRTHVDDESHASLALIRRCLVHTLRELNPDVVRMLGRATRAVTRDVFEAPFIPRWYWRRVVLIGDAAHGALPCFFNHGASLCVEDAALLTVALSNIPLLRDSGVQYAFHRFELARRSRVERYIRQARRARRFTEMPNYVLRNSIAHMTPSFCIGYYQRWLTHWSFGAQQLHIDLKVRPEVAFR